MSIHVFVLAAAQASAAATPKAAPKVQLNPDPSGLPGSSVLQGLVDGLAFWALIAAGAAFVVGLTVWALASHGNNHHWTTRGKSGATVALLAAFGIGAAAAVLNFFYAAGGKVK